MHGGCWTLVREGTGAALRLVGDALKRPSNKEGHGEDSGSRRRAAPSRGQQLTLAFSTRRHWYYEDFVRPSAINPSLLPSFGLRHFSLLMFRSCPLLHAVSLLPSRATCFS